ncbi:MAG: ankyrin repeat protein [Planctomycetota bacterium]|jgi:ankyrin repeat protein
MNPLPDAANQGDLKLVSDLLGVPHPQYDMDLALARACCSGFFDVAQALIDAGADPNGQYSPDGTFEYGPIILASCELLRADGIKFLLSNGADPRGNSSDSNFPQCHSPLEMIAASYSKGEEKKAACLELLKAAGA